MSHGAARGATKRPNDKDAVEENEPLEEVGPVYCDANQDLCEKRPHEFQPDRPNDSEYPLRDEIAEQFPVEEIPMVPHPVDGLPVPANERHGLATAAPFTADHVICVENDSQLVEVFEEELRSYVDRNGEIDDRLKGKLRLRSAYNIVGADEERLSVEKQKVESRWGHRVLRVGDQYVLMRATRERCRYYKRQVFNNEDEPDETQVGHQLVFRNCTMRRSVGGAFMSLKDEAVYMCDYRDPPDPRTVARQDEIDAEHLRSNAHKTRVPLFRGG